MSEIADLLERFRRGPELLAVATTGVAGSMLDFKPSEKAWSIRQVVCHLTDFETVLTMRMRQVIAEDDPLLPGFDGEKWAESLDYSKRKLSQALETFRILRGENFELLKDLPEAAFERPARHTELGPVSLHNLLQYAVEHVESHARQIQRNREAYKEHRAKQAQPAS